MHKSLINIGVSVIFCMVSFGLIAQDALSPRIANYEIDVTLDTQNKILNGYTTLKWKNTSDEPVTDLYFHLYYNAFRNTESTFFKERGVPEFLTQNIDDECGWGWSEILEIKDQVGNDLTAQNQYVALDDGNTEDKTVLKVQLQNPILPGESQKFEFSWAAKVPQSMPRTGYNFEYYFLAQWFPKVGVYETKGTRFATENQWNCHQYHSMGEYYSDFGNYEVNITVPLDYVVAASGALQGQSKTDSTRTWKFSVDDVIDYTWSTSPHFKLVEDNYKETAILYYSYPEKSYFATRYFKALKYTMEFLEDKLGEYPYSTISVVDPPIHGLYTGGMEYPTLISSLSFCSFPEGFKTQETLVVHEFIHQYFMQMIATHEVEEAWMDEGITTYYENRILDAFMSSQTSFIEFMGINIGSKEFNRGEYLSSKHPKIASNAIKSWEYKHGGYGEIAYNKTAVWLQTLEGILGTESMDDIMKNYFQRWKFKHPCRDDFMDVVNEYVINNHADQFPDGMDWYFEQVLFGTNACDYSLASIDNTEIDDRRGFIKNTAFCEVEEQNRKKYNSEVIVHRLGEVQVPIEIKLIFEDGTSKFFQWDGKERSYSIEIETDQKIKSAIIDPERKIYLDNNFINNSLILEPKQAGLKGFIARCLNSVTHAMETMTMLI